MIFYEPKPLNAKVGDKVIYTHDAEEFTIIRVLKKEKLYYIDDYSLPFYIDHYGFPFPCSIYSVSNFWLNDMKKVMGKKTFRIVKVPNKKNQSNKLLDFIKKIFGL
jgi:hypothetical protein